MAVGREKNVRDPLTRKIRQEKRPATETEKWLRHFPELQIIDDEIFAKAQELLAENAERHTNHRQKMASFAGHRRASHDGHPRHLLAGLIVCQCGRKLHVGGPMGSILFCRGYGMGVCSCQTTLNRALAEQLILQEIGQRIAVNPHWVELLWSAATRSYEKLQRELPDERRGLEDALADVNKRIGMLVANSEKQIIPELESRMEVLRSERERLQLALNTLLAKGQQQEGPPTREWIEKQLGRLHEVLQDRGPAAAHALRALVGDKIVVSEIRRPGRKRHFLRGLLELRLGAMAQAIEVQVDDNPVHDPSLTETVQIDFRRPERHEQIADEAKRLWDDGVPDLEICPEIRLQPDTAVTCSRLLVSAARARSPRRPNLQEASQEPPQGGSTSDANHGALAPRSIRH